MNRRNFLSGKFSERRDIRFLGFEPKIEGGLEPETRTLDRTMAYHLLRRMGFGPTPEMVAEFTGLSPDEAAEKILGDGTETLPDGYDELDWLDTPEEDPLRVNNTDLRFSIMGKLTQRYREFTEWLLKQMRNQDGVYSEKLALFWSTVWTIEFTYDTLSLVPPPLLYRNYKKLNEMRLGNYKDIALEITLDGAMLLYQSLHYSGKAAPNENYARELLELFTMGIGNYTESDIQVASALFTGWRSAAYLDDMHPNGYFNTYFVPEEHALGTDGRTFMGVTIPPINEADNTEYQVKEKEVKAVIDIMFDKRKYEIAKFVSEKIYRYFVYASEADTDENIISDMSELMVQSDFELRPLFKALLTSKHFYDVNAIGIQFKTPPEFIAGFARQLGVDYNTSRVACENLEQVLYDPPNVGSWKGYRTWLSTTTLPLRTKYALEILNKADYTELAMLCERLGNTDNLSDVVTNLLEYFLARIPDTERTARYQNAMESVVSAGDWNSTYQSNKSKAGEAVYALIEEVIYSPDFQLS